MSKIAPPFRADHVGSLLRTPASTPRAPTPPGESTRGPARVEDEIAAMIPQLEPPASAASPTASSAGTVPLDFLQQLGGITIDGVIAASSDAEETVHLRRPGSRSPAS